MFFFSIVLLIVLLVLMIMVLVVLLLLLFSWCVFSAYLPNLLFCLLSSLLIFHFLWVQMSYIHENYLCVSVHKGQSLGC